MTGGPVTLAGKAFAEIRERHRFFAAWYAGTCSDDALVESLSAFAAEFRRVGPDGAVSDRGALFEHLRTKRASIPGGMSIGIEDEVTLWDGTNAVLVSYVERQRAGGSESRRRSTALLLADDTAPFGAIWRHVQDTWINPPAEIRHSDRPSKQGGIGS